MMPGSYFAGSLALFSLLTPSARAVEYCEPKRLDAPGYSMEHVTVRDQAFLNICYAETLVQMADAFRFSQPNQADADFGFQSSAFKAAITAAKDQAALQGYVQGLLASGKMFVKPGDNHYSFAPGFTPDFSRFNLDQVGSLDGGDVCALFRQVKKTGTVSALASETGDLRSFAAPLWIEWQRTLREINPASPKVNLRETLPPETPGITRAESVAATLCRSGISSSFEEIESALRSGTELAILALAQAVPTEPTRAVAANGCAGVPSMPSRPAEFLKVVHQRLDEEKPQPLSASICATFLQPNGGKAYEGVLSIQAENGGMNIAAKNDCGPHNVLVIGRRKKPDGTCQLLIRNSWGTSENGYSEDWTPEKGNVWVDEDSFSKNVRYLQSLE